MKKVILSAVIGCLMLTGCTGPFQLTKAVHKWQTSFTDKWVDEVAFLGCVFLPVYGLATLADAIILNSVEFWTGDNPMNATVENGDASALMTKTDDGLIRIDSEGQTCFLERTNDGVVATDADGQLLFTSSTEGTLVKITNADGEVVKVFPKS
jgi:uncharacterized lipoprotein NlpE involved in copper resistance